MVVAHRSTAQALPSVGLTPSCFTSLGMVSTSAGRARLAQRLVQLVSIRKDWMASSRAALSEKVAVWNTSPIAF
jgi:hypothetical protein